MAQEWPTSGPEFNAWHRDVARLADIVQKSPGIWLKDSPLKYLELRIDTRSGCFRLYDTDHNEISPDRIVAAAAVAEAEGYNEVYKRNPI